MHHFLDLQISKQEVGLFLFKYFKQDLVIMLYVKIDKLKEFEIQLSFRLYLDFEIKYC
jgi:hypothetical protein